MRFRTLVLFGTAATAAFVISQAGQDETIRAHADDFIVAVEQAQLAVNERLRTTAELPPVLTGAVQVLDGRTLHYVSQDLRVRIAGIEVCEDHQLAYFDGTPWPCGTMSTAWLVSQTLGRSVECQRLDRRSDGIILARCGVDGADIAGEAIASGQALVSDERWYGVPRDVYLDLQEQARTARTGIWASVFTNPVEVRQSRFEDRSSQVRRVDEPRETAAATNSGQDGSSVLTGEVRVIDGDTFDLGDSRIRLWGIDAPESDTEMGPPSTEFLRSLLVGAVECQPTGDETFNRIVARCTTPSGDDVGEAMVSAGWAIDWPSYSDGVYAEAQRMAISQVRGMFAEGVEPWH
ncbi:thermonuclease family protein [Aureimonas altamirensis]|uniref:thermonuclease family protein n=1 Tax=Aureimonas altamirensis TaxID=370622 RepID=UPI0025548714|nr:thermonuclease family protein [Aureimonas altamirensis]